MKLKVIILIINCLIFRLAFTQNIVTNGGFENYSSLPLGGGECYKCVGWSNLNGSTTVAWPYASPEYLHVLGSGGVQLPNSSFGSVTPYSGNAIMGFVSGRPSMANYREYLSTQLSSPLVVGKTYNVSFWISNGDSNYLASLSSDGIGILFSSLSLSQSTHKPIGGIPQLEIVGQVWSSSWQMYLFSFTADSAYNYLTIGNFYDDVNTNTQVQLTASLPISYYFVDEVKVIPALDIIGDSIICLGDSTTLVAIEGANFIWVDSLNPNIVISTDSTITVSPTVTTTYLVFGNNDTASITVYVNYPPPPINLGNDTAFCQGESLQLDATSSNATYLWQDSSTNTTYNVTQSGIYWVELTNNCSTSSDTIIINVKDIPIINLGNDTSLCSEEVLILNTATLNGSYLWQDNSTDSIFTVSEEGIYSVIVFVDGCAISDEINILVQECEILLSVPNTITPNGDGNNDTWIIGNIEEYPDHLIQIFNRNGSLIFSSRSYQNDWGGTYNGKKIPATTYYYLIKLNEKGILYKGDITIIRE